MIQLDYPWGFTEHAHTFFIWYFTLHIIAYVSLSCRGLMSFTILFLNRNRKWQLLFNVCQMNSTVLSCLGSMRFCVFIHSFICLFISRPFKTQAFSRRQWCNCVENRGKVLLGLMNLKNCLCRNCGWERAFKSFSLSRRHKV